MKNEEPESEDRLRPLAEVARLEVAGLERDNGKRILFVLLREAVSA
jgi:hypothetical protein